jgi:excisionase family DNA binding protein
MAQPLLTTGQVAELLGVDRSTVARDVQRGVLTPSYRTTRIMLFEQAEVERYRAEVRS